MPLRCVRIAAYHHGLPFSESLMKFRIALLPLCLLASQPAFADTRGFEVRDLVALDRVSSPTLSPDGSVVVFAKHVMDKDVVKASTGLWMRNLLARDMVPPRQFTPEGWNVNSPAFSPDGKSLYFLSAKSGTQQLYSMPLQGGAPRPSSARFARDERARICTHRVTSGNLRA